MTRLENLVYEVKHDMDMARIPYNREIPIIENNRLRSVAGKCFYKTRNGVTFATRIEINGKMLKNESDDFLRNTICHELLHSASECVRSGHTGNWKRYAQLMNIRNKKYNITRCYESSEVSCSYSKRLEYKYKITCMDCGKVYYYKRKTKAVEYIMNGNARNMCWCGVCNSHNLIVEEL